MIIRKRKQTAVMFVTAVCFHFFPSEIEMAEEQAY